MITFDPFPLYIADIFYGWPLRVELGEASVSLFFIIITVQAVAIVEQSRFAHTWIKRMKGDIRQREGPKMQAQLVDCFVNRQEMYGEGNSFSLFLVTQVTISQFCSFSYF